MTDEDADPLMEATYRALCAHGYASLTMQDIADETDVSKAALHYHYDSKHDLLVSFLDYLYAEFTDRVRDPVGSTPAERLETFIDDVLVPPEPDEDERVAFGTAMLELKAQAPYDEEVRERLERFDSFLYEQARTLISEGIEAGEFRPVDPEDTARFLVTALDGAGTKRVSVGQDTDCTRRMLHSYVETNLAAGTADAGGTATGTEADTGTGTSSDDGNAASEAR
ncbi:MAG: TetR/AcrR family transcriptional regulator [Haloarculaceae archaeon]